MQLQGTRTFLEPRVGSKHSVEVILHLRSADLEWFHSNGEEHFQEILHLLSDSMVPRMCYEEVEHYLHKKDPLRFPKDVDDKIGEKNHNNNHLAKPGKKRKRGGKKQTAPVVGQAQDDKTEDKTQKVNTVYYAFGESLYCAYKTEDINTAGSATLVFKKNDDDKDNKAKKNDGKLGGGAFLQLKKLSKRFIVYCFKTDPNDPGAPDPPDAGYLGTYVGGPSNQRQR